MEVQQAFPDGIFWVTVGIEPLLVSQQSDLAEALSGERLVFTNVNEGKTQLKILWAERASLLILDDVWQVADAEAFNALGFAGRLLITTRDGELITGLGATSYPLDVLNDTQALELLAVWAGVAVSDLPEEAKAVAAECGNLPLALAQCGAMVRDLTPWADLLDAFKDSDLGFIQKQFANYPHSDVFKALHISAEMLAKTNPMAAERYLELEVFPADGSIPEAAVLRLWQHTGALKEREARKILTTLASKGMLRVEGELPQRSVSLHNLQQDYLRTRQTNPVQLHEEMLAAYRGSCPLGWHEGPIDGYFFEHLAYHLLQAQRQDEFRSLLLDFLWIRSKLNATDINTLLADYERLPDDAELRLIQSALQLSAHVLSRDKGQIQSQLYGRLLSLIKPELKALVQQIAQFRGTPWLRCLVPSLTQSGGPLLRTLTGHKDDVTGVVVSGDGKYVITASKDRRVKVWKLKTGQEVYTLRGHTDWVTGVTVTRDEEYVLSASRDRTVKVWELKTGREVRTLTGHTDWVTGVTVTRNGEYVLSASRDKAVKIWELKTGREIRTLTGHVFGVYQSNSDGGWRIYSICLW
jgi:ribosomal protein L21